MPLQASSTSVTAASRWPHSRDRDRAARLGVSQIRPSVLRHRAGAASRPMRRLLPRFRGSQGRSALLQDARREIRAGLAPDPIPGSEQLSALVDYAWRATPMACPLLLRRSSAGGPELRQDTRSDDQVAMESRPRRAAVAERPARSRCWARVFAFAEGFRSYFSSGSVLDQQSVAVQCVRRKRRQEHPGC